MSVSDKWAYVVVLCLSILNFLQFGGGCGTTGNLLSAYFIMLQRADIKTLLVIASLFFCRIWGIFLLLPVLPAMLVTYPGVDAQLAGWAVGAYGLCQACMQLPLSLWSDQVGRQRVILIGFSLLAVGSWLAGYTNQIEWIILGRCLQGAGAIGACLMAMVGDCLGLGKRALGMAIVGMSIGAAFMSAMLLGPYLVDHLQLAGLFHFIAGLAGLGFIIAWKFLPKPQQAVPLLSGSWREALGAVLRAPVLMALNFSVLAGHAALAGLFFVVDLFNPAWPRGPFVLALLLGFVGVLPLMRRFDAPQAGGRGYRLGFILMVCGLSGLWWCLWQTMPAWPASMGAMVQAYPGYFFAYVGALTLFFAGFSLLEALLPSAVSRYAPLGRRGASMGVYAMCQFFGIFLGGVTAGWLAHGFSKIAVLSSLLAWCTLGWCVWWRVAIRPPAGQLELQFEANDAVVQDLSEKILALPGVWAVNLVTEQGFSIKL